MAQLDTTVQKRAFYRNTFEIKEKGATLYRHTLLINPEDISIEEPHRVTVTQTLGGGYISLFGQAMHNVTISGKTGFHARRNAEGQLTDGYEEISNLRKLIYRDFVKNFTPSKEMFWYNWEDEEYYKVIPLTMRIQKSTSLGLMYRYEIQLVCVEALGAQTKPSVENLLSAVDALSYGKNLATASSSISESLQAFNVRSVG